MNINHLITFYFVIKLESISKAAKLLFLSQPGVSYQLSILEKEFGLTLVNYENKKMLPTKAGERLYYFAEMVYHEQKKLIYDMEHLKNGLIGDLAIAASPGSVQYVVPKIISSFNLHYPSISTITSVAPSNQVIELIMNGTHHLGFVSREPQHTAICSCKLTNERVVAIVGKNHMLASHNSVSLNELNNNTLICCKNPGGDLHHDPLDEAISLGFDSARVKSKLVLGSNDGIISAVAAGNGFAFISTLAVDRLPNHVKVLSISEFKTFRSYYCIYQKDYSNNPLLDAFVDFLKRLLESKASSYSDNEDYDNLNWSLL